MRSPLSVDDILMTDGWQAGGNHDSPIGGDVISKIREMKAMFLLQPSPLSLLTLLNVEP